MIIVQGEVYLEKWHIDILKKESEIVRKRYHAVVRTLVSDLIRITRQEAAYMISRSKTSVAANGKKVQRRRYYRSEVQIQKTT